MSIHNFIPQVWSKNVATQLRKAAVLANLMNDDYQGDVIFGEAVHLVTPQTPAVKGYTPRTTDVAYETLTSTTQALVIDHDVYWAFSVDDLEQAQADVDLMATYSEEAAAGVAAQIDDDIAILHADVGKVIPVNVSVSPAGVRMALIAAARYLDENDAPQEGRFAVLGAGLDAAVREEYGDYADDAELKPGQFGRAEGFDLYTSTSIVKVGNKEKNLFGTSDGWTLAMQIIKIEAMPLEDGFETGVRGRIVWGRKIVRAGALGVLDATIAPDTTP